MSTESSGPRRLFVGIYLFTAVIMTVAAGVFIWVSRESRKEAAAGTSSGTRQQPREIPAERYEMLAHFEPPQYAPAVSKYAGFQKAMERYAHGDYAGAAGALRPIVTEHPDFTEGRFYLGASSLLANDRSTGIAQFRAVIAAGDSPYLEQAHFLLAKALLSAGDIAGAEQELDAVIGMHAALEKQAAVLRAQIRVH